MRTRKSFVEQYTTGLAEHYDELFHHPPRRYRQRMERVFELAGELAGTKVLDLGCAVGATAIEASRRGARAVTAIDFAPKMVELAEKNARDEGVDAISFVVGDVSEAHFAPSSFDMVIASDIVEHLYPDLLRRAMRQCYEVLRPGGRLVLHTTPTRYMYLFTIFPVMSLLTPISVFPGRWQDRLVEVYYRTLVQWGHLLLKGRTYDRALEDRPHCNPQTLDGIVAVLKDAGFEIEYSCLEEFDADREVLTYRISRILFRRCSHRKGHICITASKPADAADSAPAHRPGMLR